MRVITGSARGRKLVTLEGLDVRPTADQVKEAMFSMIQFEIEGARVLDLFCGSGQLGIEALSRGAAAAIFIDASKASLDVTWQNLQRTGLTRNGRMMNSDALAYLRICRDQFDIAVMDPPYHKGLAAEALPLLAEKMNPGGVIIAETAFDEDLPETAGRFRIHKANRYGKIKLTVYREAAEETEE